MRKLQERRVVFSVSLPANLEGELVRLAEAHGKSRSGMVAEIVAGALSHDHNEVEVEPQKTGRTE